MLNMQWCWMLMLWNDNACLTPRGVTVGFALGGKGEHVYGKVGEFSGLSPSEKPLATPKLIKINPLSLPNPLWKMECLKNLQELHPRNKFGFQNQTISGTHLTLYWTSLRIPFLKPKSYQEWHIPTKKWADNHLREWWGITVTIAIGMVTLLSFALGGREMSGGSMSWTTETCTARPMAYMCRLFRGWKVQNG
jgi:hypothetical protein